MKKALLLLLACAGITAGQAQTTILTETFDTPNGAEGWVIENLGTSSQQWRYTNINPGFLTTGETGTLFAYGYNAQAGQTHNGHTVVTSTAFDCSSASSVFMQWEHIYDVVQSNSTCKIDVSNDSTNWTNVYTNTASTGGVALEFADLTAVAANQATVYIRFDFKSTGDRYWIVDDLKIFAPQDIGVEALAGNIVAMTSGAPAVTYTTNSGTFGYEMSVRNLGADAITSLKIDYSINGGATQTATVTGLNIAALETGDVLLSNILDPSSQEGFYSVDATITEINGVVDQEDEDNSTSADAIFYAAANAKPRTPVVEVFTSSTCGPCTPGNIQIHSVLDSKPEEDYVMIKYQQNFPGTGDPYCTAESVSRRSGYYNNNSIPHVRIDGGWGLNGNSFTNNVYNQYKAIPGVGEMTGTYSIDAANQTVNYDITFTPNFDMPDNETTLQIVIMEKLTTRNIKSNGETKFENVMKKMVNGENGTVLTNVTAGTPMTFSGSYKFNGNYRLPSDANSPINHATEHSIEEFSDLEVAAFVQAVDLKQILSGSRMENTTVGIKENVSFFGFTTSPNPFQDNLRLNINSLNAAKASVTVVNTLGKVVYSNDVEIATGAQHVNLNLANLASGIYTVVLSADGVSEQVKVSKF